MPGKGPLLGIVVDTMTCMMLTLLLLYIAMESIISSKLYVFLYGTQGHTVQTHFIHILLP